MDTCNETLGALLKCYAGDHDEPRPVPRIRSGEALHRGDDPRQILPDPGGGYGRAASGLKSFDDGH
jgi:hypothetical protein